jgi:hypothetical protein
MLKVASASAAGAALVAVIGRHEKRRPLVRAPQPARPEVAETTFLGDLAGAKLGAYTVQSVGELERGGIPVTMATASGETFRVDVLRTELLGPPGIGPASTVSTFLCNGGDGNTPTDEERGLGAMALAKELARRTRKGEKPPAALLTMTERAALDAVS